MKKENVKKIGILSIILCILSIILIFVLKAENNLTDSISYKGKKYICLEYNMDIFTYNFNSNDYYEEDIIHPILHDKWDMVYFNGDLFIEEESIKAAKVYYSNDKNYEWFIVFDENDSQITIPIELTEEEIKYIYNMDNMKKTETMTFEEIKMFANITKISKDKKVFSLISLANYKGSWYWKTEIMTDDKAIDEEYIIKLPESLNNKISMIIKDY